MIQDFVKERTGSASIHDAVKQHEQLAYFISSDLQTDITQSYLEQWAKRNYAGNDYFLNWVKTIFKTDNFLSFFKYLRNPNPASKLINTRIKEPLSRVFFAEDSYFNYVIRNKETEEPEELNDGFEQRLFNAVLYSHNDIVVHDLNDINTPYREIIEIEKVVAIEAAHGKIKKLAYSASTMIEGQKITGYAYLDNERYAFLNTDCNIVSDVPHDLGKCPAAFISDEAFGKDEIVRKSMFSFLRGDLEEYVFLKTLQKMTEPNGAIPVVTMLDTKEKKRSGKDIDSTSKMPMNSNEFGGQSATEAQSTKSATEGSHLQTGTIIKVPSVKKQDGSIDMDLAKNFLTFFYIPVEALKYLNDRIKEIEQGVIVSVLGDYSEANESAKNELQVSKSYVSKEDKLRWLSNTLSKVRNFSDYAMLGLKYGRDAVQVDGFYGSDFFLETQAELFELFQNSPNAIERKNILSRMAQSRNKFNKVKARREMVLYKLLPYASDNDFKVAIEQQAVSPEDFQLQTRFQYWISLFEAKYGNIITFWETEVSESQKIIMILNLLYDLINSNTPKNGKETNRTPESVPGA